ncbi:MAG: recombinase family protein [Planctomycetota bacterium]
MAKESKAIRCAIYTRKSHEEGLDQEFNSLDAQRSAAESYIQSQVHEGWKPIATRYDDGGFSGGNIERPALSQLMEDIRYGLIDCVVVYKVDRLSRSLLDFSKLVALFDEHNVSFVSVTQQFNTTTSMGRLTLNILLSFAQFEREIIGERIRDKKLATARQGKYIGGQPKLGLDIIDRRYVVNEDEAKLVRRIFKMLLELASCRKVADKLNAEGLLTKRYETKTGKTFGGTKWIGRRVYDIVTDQKYIGKIVHKGVAYDAEHKAIVSKNQFDAAQNMLAKNKTYTHKHQKQRFALLRRMLRCGECGSFIMPAWTKNHGREYRYYTCAKKVKKGYKKCSLPTLPAGEIETLVVDQLREFLRHPEMIAHTFREVASCAAKSKLAKEDPRLEELHGRRQTTERAIRSLLALDDPDSAFLQTELQRFHAELKVINHSITEIESEPNVGRRHHLNDVLDSLKRLDGVWEHLVADEQQRVLNLLIRDISVNKKEIKVRFRSEGIEQIASELNPLTNSGGLNGKNS